MEHAFRSHYIRPRQLYRKPRVLRIEFVTLGRWRRCLTNSSLYGTPCAEPIKHGPHSSCHRWERAPTRHAELRHCPRKPPGAWTGGFLHPYHTAPSRILTCLGRAAEERHPLLSPAQFRIHTSSSVDVYISIGSNPIIEHCSSIRFADYPGALRPPDFEAVRLQSCVGGRAADQLTRVV